MGGTESDSGLESMLYPIEFTAIFIPPVQCL